MQRRTRSLLTAVACLALLAGCSDDPDDTSSGDPSAPPDTSSSAPATDDGPTGDEPTEDAETGSGSEPPPSEGNSNSKPKRAKKSRIEAEELPGLNDDWEWTQESSGKGPGQDMSSVCMVASLTAIGGVAEHRTDYGNDQTDTARATLHTVVFPDEKTATNAVRVIEAWHDACKARAKDTLGLKKARVSKISKVDTSVGDGEQWMVTYRPVPNEPDSVWFQAEGFVRDGDTLSYLIVVSAGQDYNYERGHEPIDEALRIAADRLLATR